MAMGTGKHILVVEDDQDIAQLVKARLEAVEFSCAPRRGEPRP